MSAVGMGGFPPSIQLGGGSPADSGSTKSDGDWEQDLQSALSALRELAGDAEDHTEATVIDQCVKAISGLMAKRQQGAESALGVKPEHKAMRRAAY